VNPPSTHADIVGAMATERSTVSDIGLRVVAPSLREQALEVLRDAILDFRLEPGRRLTERELIEQTGVSRTTLREVLRELAAEGLVETVPRKGVLVTLPSPFEAAQLYEVRAGLESFATRLFTLRATKTEVAELRQAFNAFRRQATEGSEDPVAQRLASRDAIDVVLLAGCRNDPLRWMIESLRGRVRVLRLAALRQTDEIPARIAELRTIVRAIEARDAEAAAIASRRHTYEVARAGLRGLAERDPRAVEALEAIAVSE
jgi:DNA-binding GntR family transcriptional regulator